MNEFAQMFSINYSRLLRFLIVSHIAFEKSPEICTSWPIKLKFPQLPAIIFNNFLFGLKSLSEYLLISISRCLDNFFLLISHSWTLDPFKRACKIQHMRLFLIVLDKQAARQHNDQCSQPLLETLHVSNWKLRTQAQAVQFTDSRIKIAS